MFETKVVTVNEKNLEEHIANRKKLGWNVKSTSINSIGVATITYERDTSLEGYDKLVQIEKQIDELDNKAMKELYNANDTINKKHKKSFKLLIPKILVILGMIIGYIFGPLLVISSFIEDFKIGNLIFGILLIAFSIGLIFLNKFINKKITQTNNYENIFKETDKIEDEIENLLKEAETITNKAIK